MSHTASVHTQSAVQIRPRLASWDALRASTGIDTRRALAEVLGVSENTVNRVLDGVVEPSTRFIAHTLHAFPFASFDRLFTLARRTP